MVSDLYPFDGRFFDRGNGIRLHYLDEGSGDPVVMVHGNPTWSFYYRKLVLELRRTNRCIVPDHIGCGLSDKPDDSRYDYSLRARIDDLEALLESLNIRSNVTLIVHDWGGMIGMGWAARMPDRVKKLVILNTGAFPLPPSKRFPFVLWLGRNTSLGEFLIRRLNMFSKRTASFGVKRRPMTAAVRAGYLRPYDSYANRIAVARFVQTIPLSSTDAGYEIVQEVEKSLPKFRHLPILICWGMKDFVFDVEFLKRWEREFPEAKIHRFGDAGHYILEDAADEVIPLIRDFV